TRETMTFAQFVELAAEYNPDLRTAQAQADAARGRFVQAGLYPNPTVGSVASDIGTLSNQTGKQGPSLNRTLVTPGTLRIPQAAAAHGITAADWQALTRWYDVLGRLRSAFYDVLAARREVEVASELVRIAQKGLSAAERLQMAGAGGK